MKILIILIAIALTGCATRTKIAPYGKDTYIVSASNSGGVTGSSALQVHGAQKATAYCAQQGKDMIVDKSTTRGAQWWTSTSATLIFKCIDRDNK